MGLVMNGVDYGTAWCASGALGFFSEGYPFHHWLRPLGLAPDFRGATLVAKTTTYGPRAGNLPLRGTTPTEVYPRSIRVNLRRAAVLNAVGLSGPGVRALLDDGRWQARTDPFVLSFMAVAADAACRRAEARRFAHAVAKRRRRFRAPFALEVNSSCVNVGRHGGDLGADVADILGALADYLPGVPLIPKLSVLVAPAAAAALAADPRCAALCCSNTLPWGALPDRIDWEGLFGARSPLAAFGGGGLSGAPLTPLVREWVAAYRRLSRVPLVAGGGVMTPGDATALLDLGAAAVEVGSVAIVRPWRVGKICAAIHAWKPEETPCKA